MKHHASWSLVVAVVLASGFLAGCVQQEGGDGAGGIKTQCGGTSAATFSGAGAGLLREAASAPSAIGSEVGEAAQPSGGLVIGTLVPLTGSLEAYGGDMERAVEMAVDEINRAGGVNGQQVRVVKEDSQSNAATAPQAFQRLVSEKVSGVVGAAGSAVTGSILEAAKNNNVMVVTPASTSPTLTLDRDNGGYFLRIPPSDALQGKVLAQTVYQDGCRSAVLIAVNNDYGVGLSRVFEETFKSLGGTIKAETVKFPANAQTFSSEVQKAASANADAIVLVGYPQEGVPLMKEAFQRGAMGKSVFFFSEGVRAPAFVTGVGKTSDGKFVLAGLKGTAPTGVASPGFEHFNRTFHEKHGRAPGLFAAESYDATWIIALAAQCASANTGSGIKDNVLKVVNRDGPADVAVSGSNAVLALNSAKAGCGINYQGAAHDFDFDTRGDPKEGVYSVWQVGPDGAITTVRSDVRP